MNIPTMDYYFSPSLFGLLHIANGSICNVSGFPCLGQIQINLDQAAHCHGSNFNVSSSPNQHSYQLDHFFFHLHVAAQTSSFSRPSHRIPLQHLDKHRMKRSKPYASCSTNPSTLATCPITTINIDSSKQHFTTE